MIVRWKTEGEGDIDGKTKESRGQGRCEIEGD
jgi:hypothetical protein